MALCTRLNITSRNAEHGQFHEPMFPKGLEIIFTSSDNKRSSDRILRLKLAKLSFARQRKYYHHFSTCVRLSYNWYQVAWDLKYLRVYYLASFFSFRFANSFLIRNNSNFKFRWNKMRKPFLTEFLWMRNEWGGVERETFCG